VKIRSTYRQEIARILHHVALKRRNMNREGFSGVALLACHLLIGQARARQDSADFWQPLP
jgi:hypothetical protein